MKAGDIYLYSNKGKAYPTSGRPVGCALVVDGIKEDDAGNRLWVSVRNAHNLSTYRVYPDQLEPVPDGEQLNDVLVNQFMNAIGEGGRDHFASVLKVYQELVEKGRIPEIDESRIVRAAPAPKP
ncbi:hypothetical protein [Mesorhizobium sp. SP-1A]|uniref:hypothetical protein n=1 Tax=Mesorhizobium sp. SP-1A TaxID=3077840 RepID=UPI0028F6E05C|nr:hypothetical protein [Mesorhizobium sp. SP-1A]